MTKRKNVINETDDSESASDYSPTKIKCKRDQKNKKKLRKNEEFKREEQEINTASRKEARENEETRKKEQERDKACRKGVRENEEARKKEQEINTANRALFRSKENIIMRNYFLIFKECCTHVCSSCGNLWFRSSVRYYERNQLLQISDDFLRKYCKKLTENKICLCNTCRTHVLKNKVPPLNLSNGLEFLNLPECLIGLTELEERFISPRIPFMIIKELAHQG